MSLAEEISRLAELKQQGHLSETEFEAAKKQLLGGTERVSTDHTHEPSVSAAVMPSAPSQPRPQMNGLSIASLILGLVGLGIGSVLALVFGYRAKNQIDRSEGQQSGRGMAIAGIILGWIGVVAAVALATIFLVARVNAQDDVETTLR